MAKNGQNSSQVTVCTVLQKLSKCEVKEARCGFYNLPVTKILREIKRSKNVVFGTFKGSEFKF